MSLEKAFIRAVKIRDLEGYNPDEFCVSPSNWGYRSVEEYPSEALLSMAQEKASAVDDICIIVVADQLGEYVITSGYRLRLFNATLTYDKTGVRAVTYNRGRGALTAYWYDRRVVYRAGSMV